MLLVPIGFGCIMVNIPLSGLMEKDGFLRVIYDTGVITETVPLSIFVGIGAMTDFGPVLENPYTFLFGAAGQFGIFLTLLLALALNFPYKEAVTIGIIGACDGPTAIYVASQYAQNLLGPVSVAAYSYMSLVPVLQPPIMRTAYVRKRAYSRDEDAQEDRLQDDQDTFPDRDYHRRRPHRPQRSSPSRLPSCSET